MKISILILTVACFSCMVPEVWSAPFVNPVSLGAAAGAFKGALDGANQANAKAAAAKGVGNIIKFISKKAFQALLNNGFLKDIALKTVVQGATLGTGIAIGAAVTAHKPHFLKHGPLIKHHEEHHVPVVLDSYPSHHGGHPFESAPDHSEVVHVHTHESHGQPEAYHGPAHSEFLHLQEHSDGIYR